MESSSVTWAVQEDRVRRDSKWAISYAVCCVVTMAGILYSACHMSSVFWNVGDPGFMNDANSCPVERHGRSLKEAQADKEFDAKEFWGVASGWLIGSAVLSLVIGWLFVHLFKKAARTMVLMACAFQVIPFIVAAIALCDPYPTRGSFLFAAMGALVAFCLYLWRRELELVARLLTIAGKGLAANPGLVPASLGINVANCFALIPLSLSFLFSAANGVLVRNPYVVQLDSSGMCLSEDGKPINCCSWQLDSWVMPYWALAAFGLIWTITIFAQTRTYTIAGTITQWYFMGPTTGSTRRSLHHALTTSFGSICASSLILAVCQIIRNMIENARSRARGGNILAALAVCLVQGCLSLIEAISQFATVQMAATGEAFFDATHTVTQLLARHALSSVGVWWFPTMVLQFSALAVSILWGLVVGLLSLAMWSGNAKYHYSATNAAIVAVFSGVVCFITLSFVSAVLKDIVDTVYVCFARDLDNHTVTNAEVHAVYASLPPAKGAVVVQPDEQLVYGAMEEGGVSSYSGDLYRPLVGSAQGAAPSQAAMTREIYHGSAAAEQEQQPLIPGKRSKGWSA